MADLYPGLFDGAVDAEAYVINAIADEQITIGSPVILVAPGTGENLPRVEPTATLTDFVYGVVVGGDLNGTYGGTSEIVAEAGDVVKVCVNGRCKARVDGSGTPIVLGSPLGASTTDGVAIVAAATTPVFGRAQQPSTVATDFIVVFVDQEGVVT